MNWKEKLRTLEEEGEHEKAVAFMQTFILENPDNTDGYMFMNYLLMHLLTEEYCLDANANELYKKLLKKYFKESYEKFSESAEFLYLMGQMARICEFLAGITEEDCEAMIAKEIQLEPNNLAYKEPYY